MPPARSPSRLSLWHQPQLLLVLAVLFWAGNFVLGRAVRLEVPPVGLAFWRWFGASLLLWPFAWPQLRRDWPTVRRHWRIIALLSLLGVAVFNTLIYLALQSTAAINAFLMQSLMPVLIVAMSFAFFRERLSAAQAAGVALSLLGAVTLIARGEFEALLRLALNPGDALVLVAVICYAAYSVFLKKRPAMHPLSFLLATFALGALMLLPAYVLEHVGGRAVQLNAPTLLSISYVAVFPSILSFFFFNRGVELVGANRAGLFIHLMPVFGSVLAVLLLGEAFRWYHLLGIPLIAAGIVLATRVRVAVPVGAGDG